MYCRPLSIKFEQKKLQGDENTKFFIFSLSIINLWPISLLTQCIKFASKLLTRKFYTFCFSYWAEKFCTRQQWLGVQRTPSRRSRRGHNSQICQTHQRIGTMAVMVFCLNWDDSTAGFFMLKVTFHNFILRPNLLAGYTIRVMWCQRIYSICTNCPHGLKVPSHQFRSAWKWFGWIGLGMYMDRRQ